MGLVTKTFHIGGMTCVNCQNKITKRLRSLAGIKQIGVSYQTGSAQITWDPSLIAESRIKNVIESLGYRVLLENRWTKQDMIRAICYLSMIIGLYVLLERLGILNLLVPSQLAESSMGYGMLFVVGLLTSVHCIAMCGGIHLWQCLPTEAPGSTGQKQAAILPSLLQNLGRVISYTVIGFLLGLAGLLLGGNTGLGISALLQGTLKMLAGAVMAIMGINMLGLFPWLRRINLRMPRFLTKKIGRTTADRRPFVIGLLNGLMPCGPLQSMQILALASGNPFVGALSMFLFSLGTVPLMLGLGTLVSALGKRFAHAVMNVGAVLVAVLGLAMLSQGGNLSGMLLSDTLLLITVGLCVIGLAASIPFSRKAHRVICVILSCALVITAGVLWQRPDRQVAPADSGAPIMDGVQQVSSTLQLGRYPTITVQAGVPVRWIIDAPAGSINGCNYKMILPEYDIEHIFREGENIIEFTPVRTGTVAYTCWMGMINGSIVVTESPSSTATPALAKAE